MIFPGSLSIAATAYGGNRHRAFLSVVVNCRGIFFQKAATFKAILGTRDVFSVRPMACCDGNQSLVPGESKSLAVITRRPGVVTSGWSMRMIVRAAPAA
jgi:hypothetical protein